MPDGRRRPGRASLRQGSDRRTENSGSPWPLSRGGSLARSQSAGWLSPFETSSFERIGSPRRRPEDGGRGRTFDRCAPTRNRPGLLSRGAIRPAPRGGMWVRLWMEVPSRREKPLETAACCSGVVPQKGLEPPTPCSKLSYASLWPTLRVAQSANFRLSMPNVCMNVCMEFGKRQFTECSGDA